MSVTVNHKFVSPKSEQTDPTLVGPNEWNATHAVVDTSGIIYSGDYTFTPQTLSNSLVAGSNTITLTPVPKGVNGSDTGHYVYISGGIGAAEAVLITGGTAVGGAASGTIIVTCANTHSGSWTVSTATGGIQEGICSLPMSGGDVYVNTNVTLFANVSNAGRTYVNVNKMTGFIISGNFTLFGQTRTADGRDEIYAYTSSSAPYMATNLMIAGTSPTWTTSSSLQYSALYANVNNTPLDNTGNLPQFGATGVTGAVTVPAESIVSGNASGVSGICTSASTTTAAVGVSAYSCARAPGVSAWGGNFLVSNQIAPLSTVGIHAHSIIGLELDCNIFAPGGCDGLVGIQIISLSSTIQPSASTGIQIAPLGNTTPSTIFWDSGMEIVSGSCRYALDLKPLDWGNNHGCPPIRMWATNASGAGSTSTIGTSPDGTITLIGGNGAAPTGVILATGDGQVQINVEPGGIFFKSLPVFANNAAAVGAGLLVGQLYKTATGQVMQVF